MAKKQKKKTAFVRFTEESGKVFPRLQGEIKKIVWPTPKNVFKNVGVVLGDDHPAWSLHFPAGYRLHEFAGSRHASGEISSANDRAFI